MANRLNVLVGATLEQNVEKKLNTELKVLEGKLQAIELTATFGGDFKKLAETINKAFGSIKFDGIGDSAKQSSAAVQQIDKSVKGLNGNVKKVVRTTHDLTGKLKSAEETLEDITGNKYRVKITYDESGKISGGTTDYIDNTSRTKQLDLEKKSARAIDAQRKATLKEYLTRLKWQSKEDEKNAKAQEAAEKSRQAELKKTLSLYSEVKNEISEQKKYLKETYQYSKDAYDPSVMTSFQNSVNSISKSLKNENISMEKLIQLQETLNEKRNAAKQYVSNVDSTQAEVDRQWKQQLRLNSQIDEERRKASEKVIEEENKAISDARERQLAAEEKYYKQELRWAEETRKAQEAAAEKAYSQELRWSEEARKTHEAADEKLEDRRRSELRKTQTAYEKLHKTVSEMDEASGFESEKVEKFKSTLSEIETVLKKDNAATYELINAQRKLNIAQNNAGDYVTDVNKQRTAQERLTASIEKQTASVREQLALLDVQVSTKAIKLGSRYGDLFNEQEFREVYNLTEKIERELDQIEPDFKKINSWFRQMNANASKFEAELSSTAKRIREVEKETQLLDSSLGRFVQFYWFGEIFRTGKTAVTEMVSAVSTLDASMVELKKVSDETDSTYERFMDNAANSAKELGVSISDYIDSVTSFARSGFGFEDSQEIAKTANIMQMVSEEMSAEDASSYLISIIRGFNMEASESIDIVNALNNVSNNFAVTTDGLGDALQRSSAALKTAGNDLNESIALIATANETIQNPTSVGQGWKTISINYLVA